MALTQKRDGETVTVKAHRAFFAGRDESGNPIRIDPGQTYVTTRAQARLLRGKADIVEPSKAAPKASARKRDSDEA